VPFEPPLIQGPEPSLPITATSAAAILTHQETHRQWKDSKKKYNQYKAAQAALRTLITSNVDAQFINSLSDSTTKVASRRKELIDKAETYLKEKVLMI
jgi:hypothetical protein